MNNQKVRGLGGGAGGRGGWEEQFHCSETQRNHSVPMWQSKFNTPHHNARTPIAMLWIWKCVICCRKRVVLSRSPAGVKVAFLAQQS